MKRAAEDRWTRDARLSLERSRRRRAEAKESRSYRPILIAGCVVLFIFGIILLAALLAG